MRYAQLEYYISEPRLNRFLRACGNSKTKAQKLYRINIRFSEAFYPILNLFETFLRNTIYNEIASAFHDPDWIINEQKGFMSDSSLSRGRFAMKNQVLKIHHKIILLGGRVTASKLISEQTFGFWTTFFEKAHYKLTKGCSINAFPNKPPNVNRMILEQKLSRIRILRSRIYHNEPICFRAGNIDFSEAGGVLVDIHDLMNWINPALSDYAEYFNNIQKKINQANALLKN